MATLLSSLAAGKYISFGGQKWILLKPAERYLIMANSYADRTVSGAVGTDMQNYLNTTFYNTLTNKEWIPSKSLTLGFTNYSGFVCLLSLADYNAMRGTIFPSAGEGYMWWLSTANGGGATYNVETNGTTNSRSGLSLGVRPTIYLKELNVASGSGTSADPYVVVDNQVPTLTLTSPTDNQTLAAGETMEIEGTANDSNGDSITVIASLNGTSFGTVGTGIGTANWIVSIPEPNLLMGDNTLVITAIDGQGASVNKTLKLRKTDGDVPLLINDIRYKLSGTDDVIAWARREGELTITGALSGVGSGEKEWFSSMEKSATAADEDQFYTELPVKKDKVTLRLTMTRQNVNQDVAITRLIGGIGK